MRAMTDPPKHVRGRQVGHERENRETQLRSRTSASVPVSDLCIVSTDICFWEIS